MIDAGIAFVPEDRAARGLDMGMSVDDNVTLPHLRIRGSALWTGLQWRKDETAQVIAKYDVKTPSSKTIVGTLSGGNQQKVLFGKWLLGKPTVLILEEPTQAVDVGARSALLHATREAAQEGAAVIYCSAEVDDLAAVCDRVLVLKRGRITGELRTPIDPDELLRSLFADPEEDSDVH